jgi:hypothetical protein
MKNVSAFIVLTAALGMLVFFACQKEYSCEGCKETNKPPIAAAGPDTVITLPMDSVILDGSKSGDPDGKISAWQWTKFSGHDSFTIMSATAAITTVKNLKAGAYQFELKVTDDEGASARDTVMITVDSVATTNHPPVACAGFDRNIILPTDTVTLDGSCSTDPDNNITSYSWTKITGPSSFNMANANVVRTQVSNLTVGVYQFELKVTDADGLFSKDTVQVSVDSSSGQALACDNSIRPTINARLIPVGTLSQARSFMAVASAGNKILFAGGSEWSSRVDIYDISTNKWSTAELSYGRSNGIAAVTNGNKIFFAGGETSDGTVPADVVDIYDVSTDTWTVAHLSLGGDDIAAAAVGDNVLFAGGMGGLTGGEARAGRVDIYNLATNTWSIASLSKYKVRGHVAVTANNKVYISGGSTSWLIEAPSNKIEIYDNATNTWSTGTMQEARYRHAGIVAGNKIYWGGGGTCSVEIRDVNTGNSTTQYLYRSTEFSNAVMKDNKIVFFGTHYDNPDKHVADKVDIYDIASNTWSVGVLPFSIELPSIISVNNTIYVAGGFVNGVYNVYNDKVWKLEF